MTFLKGPPLDVEWLLSRNWWADVDKTDTYGCWPWTKSTASHGYGQTWDGTTVRLAHRVAWTLTHQRAIPDDMTVDHLCRSRLCCNPYHLRLLSNENNAADNGHARKTHCPKGHPYDNENTYTDRKGHRRCRECAKSYKRVA